MTMLQGKLGKQAKRHDVRTLKFAHYVNMAALPSFPQVCDRSATFGPLGMMLNDQLGDCTIAGVAHIVQAWSGANGSPVIPSDQTILNYYSKWDGYVQGDPSTDNGGVEIDVLKSWRSEGFDGHSILAFTELNPRNHAHAMAGTFFWGGLYGGVALPLSAQGQASWVVRMGLDSSQTARGSWGGHCVPIVGYNAQGVFVITWGQLLFVSWDFFDEYFDELYCIVSGNDWAEAGRKSPSGFFLADLQNDLGQVTA